MYSSDELKSLQDFLKATNEGNLKKMLVGGAMTDNHIRLLLKVARGAGPDEWVGYVEGDSFPKMKFAPAESALKESFWSVCTQACAKVGLLTVGKKAA